MISSSLLLLLVSHLCFSDLSAAFNLGSPSSIRPRLISSSSLKSGPSDYEKKNAAVDVLSNFMQEESKDSTNSIDAIDFAAPKFQKVPLPTLAAILDYELYEKEWFVTGNVNPIYFTDDFFFKDPDVELTGIESYARGVYKLFDQETSRAEIISCVVNEEIENTITVTWRLSGDVSIGPGLTIKPYICTTFFTVNEESGLITMQEDEFSIPQWDVLLSALFPFLIGKVTSPAAPPVDRQDIPKMPKMESESPFKSLFAMFK